MRSLVAKFLLSAIAVAQSVAIALPVAGTHSILACAFGDSVTAGTGPNSPNGPVWVTVLSSATGNSIYNAGVGGQTSTQIAARFLALPSVWNDSIIIWAGFNNAHSPATVLADIAAMVAAIPHNRWCVLTLFNNDAGSLADVATINASLLATYGAHCLDANAFLLTRFDPNDSTDVAAHNQGLVAPSRLLPSQIHPNTLGNAELGAWMATQWNAWNSL